jgi:hypothetical protein
MKRRRYIRRLFSARLPLALSCCQNYHLMKETGERSQDSTTTTHAAGDRKPDQAGCNKGAVSGGQSSIQAGPRKSEYIQYNCCSAGVV